MPLNKIGAFAEYVAINKYAIAKIPDYLKFDEAACVPLTALTAIQAFELMNPSKGEKNFHFWWNRQFRCNGNSNC